MARRARPAAGRRRPLLSRPPHPQRASRPHGCLGGLLRKTVQLPPDPLLRHRGSRFGTVLARADQSRRQDPDSDQRGCRRGRSDRGISARYIAARASSTSPAGRATSIRPSRTCAPPACRSCRRRPTPISRRSMRVCPKHGEDIARLQDERHPDRRRGRRRWRPHQGAAADLLGERDRADLLRIHPAQGRRRFRRGQFQGAVRIRSKKTRFAAAC